MVLDPDGVNEDILYTLLSRPHVIIMSRPHATSIVDQLDLELETTGFLLEQVDEYLSLIARYHATEIREYINERPLVRSLASISIQLDAICYTWTIRTFPRHHVTMTALYLAISRSLWISSALRLKKKRPNGERWTMPQLQGSIVRELRNVVQEEINFL
jgi:hypothetical protein